MEAKKLWTHDFAIITVGTVISMFGNALTGFAASLMVLDYTGSTFLYSICLAIYTVPQIVMPLISGAILDRFSRKRAIYMLDFFRRVSTGWRPCWWQQIIFRRCFLVFIYF